jgi:hypothetical protein
LAGIVEARKGVNDPYGRRDSLRLHSFPVVGAVNSVQSTSVKGSVLVSLVIEATTVNSSVGQEVGGEVPSLMKIADLMIRLGLNCREESGGILGLQLSRS